MNIMYYSYKEDIGRGKIKGLTLSQKIVILVIFAIGISLFATSTLITRKIPNIIDDRLDINALKVASILANDTSVRNSILFDDRYELNNIITIIGKATNASIIIFNKDKNVLAFTNPGQITDFNEYLKNYPLDTIDYYEHVEMIAYSYNMRATNIIYDGSNEAIGYVAVAYPSDLPKMLINEIFLLVFLASLIGLSCGAMGAIYLAKIVKTTLFDLEPEQIATLLQERSTLLDTVKDGVLALDINKKFYLINKEAERLLSMSGVDNPHSLIGQDSDVLLASHNIVRVLKTGIALTDLSTIINGIGFLANVIPIYAGETITGVIITFREKTAVEELAKQLTGVRNYADALRAQAHEFMNKMHVITGLLSLEEYDELKKYLRQIACSREEETHYLSSRLKDPVLIGFILGKYSRAKELDIEFTLSDESNLNLQNLTATIHDLILIIGNLIENAFDVLKNYDGERIVNLTILTFDDEIVITVEDSGPGIPEENIEQIFTKGYSSKGKDRGIGLYLIKNNIDALKGSIFVDSSKESGTVFTIKIPCKGSAY